MVTTWLFKSFSQVPICTYFSTEYQFNGPGSNICPPADGYLLARPIRGVILNTVVFYNGTDVKDNHKHNSMDQINKLPILLSTTLQEHWIFF